MVGFERVGHLVVLAADNLKADVYKDLCVPSTNLVISFDAYVKSQVHLNLTNDFFGRPLSRYVNAMRYLKLKDEKYRQDALNALKWFYGDMASFLIHNEENVKLTVIIDDELKLPEAVYSLPDVRHDIENVIVEHPVEMLRDFKYSEMLCKINSRTDLEKKTDSCVVAAILFREANSDELHKVVLKED